MSSEPSAQPPFCPQPAKLRDHVPQAEHLRQMSLRSEDFSVFKLGDYLLIPVALKNV